MLLRKSTLEEGPALFQAATLTTVVAFLLESAVLATPIGARLFAVTWLGLSVLDARVSSGCPCDRARDHPFRALPFGR